jgi:hypothetical protein
MTRTEINPFEKKGNVAARVVKEIGYEPRPFFGGVHVYSNQRYIGTVNLRDNFAYPTVKPDFDQAIEAHKFGKEMKSRGFGVPRSYGFHGTTEELKNFTKKLESSTELTKILRKKIK